MKDYEEKAMNVIENTKSSIRYQMDKAYRQGYYDGFNKGLDVGLENGYKQGYEEGKKAVENLSEKITSKDIDDAYNRGLNDAWELVRRIENTPEDGGLTNLQIEQIFGTCYPPHELYKTFDVEEVKAGIEKFDEKQKEDAEIKVGDEARDTLNKLGVVTQVLPDNEVCNVCWMQYNGHPYSMPKKNLTKTGRHFPQIAEVLKEMRGAE